MEHLLENNPFATDAVREWFIQKLAESFKHGDIPEHFKESVIQAGITNEKITKVVGANPRSLFDLFDENQLFIETMYMEGAFHYTISNGENVILSNKQTYKTRKECDLASIEDAFKLLNEKLCPTLTES
jgi:hypothetical protein